MNTEPEAQTMYLQKQESIPLSDTTDPLSAPPMEDIFPLQPPPNEPPSIDVPISRPLVRSNSRTSLRSRVSDFSDKRNRDSCLYL